MYKYVKLFQHRDFEEFVLCSPVFKLRVRSTKRSQLKGQSLGGQSKKHICTKHTVGGSKCFVSFCSRTSRNNTDEDLAKGNAYERDRSIFNVL